MTPKNLEEVIQSLHTKKKELEEQAENLRLQMNTVTDTINSIKKNFETLVVDTSVTTQMYDLVLRECRNELSYKTPENAGEKKKPFTLKDITEKILDKEKKMPKNASITQLASQLATSRK